MAISVAHEHVSDESPEVLVTGWLDELVDRLKILELVARGGPIPDRLATEAVEAYIRFCRQLNDLIGAPSQLPEQQRTELGALAGERLAPYVELAMSASRWRSKPRGYAGDDVSIQMIYDRRPSGDTSFAKAIDALFLEMPAAQAVRNRRRLLSSRVKGVYTAAARRRLVHVMALAAGPAAEMFDAWEDLGRPGDLRACFVDGDHAAVKALQGRSAANADPLAATTLLCAAVHKANLAHVALGKHTLDVPPQDLIYSLGLADYLKDDMVVKLLDIAYKSLRPGGIVIIGNFHESNPDRACLDHVLQWRLIHRSEGDMHRLMSKSMFGAACEEIEREPTGVQMLAIGRKPLNCRL
mmetsp:Transcript_57804/g.161314  ORF Transcript_57804/g.161314 Transcript_57804/m.161314 type:complete len:354 (+) Transcript_57804:101-1162(+)|eukprot:CAMPEP_0117543814 /NCGR_PEP_ID=MMETSP0784-20121206/45252_1 /TAXON_ID=39447 /ORGANISM="" /LENGTH=353 /DNA_ID=CAMNT_0005340599 /DNA_START=44 /DNA_END=1105 /DNA_ORIENTATION=+